jgi:predicted dehydrogenase
MFYKSAILGCGPRSDWHLDAYNGLDEIKVIAACNRHEKKLNDFCDRYAIIGRYTKLESMLRKEKPEILHIVTKPTVRLEPIREAVKHGVKLIILEKPFINTPSEGEELKRLQEESGVKIVINMQRRYYSCVNQIKKLINSGEIGKIRFMRCVVKANIMDIGTHAIDMLLYWLGDQYPESIWASTYGAEDYCSHSQCPASIMANLTFPENIQVIIECSKDSVGIPGEDNFWMNFEFDIWGDKGRAWWQIRGDYGWQVEGMPEPARHPTDYFKDDKCGQREFTRAAAMSLNGNKRHLNNLDNSMRGFNIMMGIYESCRKKRRINMPKAFNDETLDSFRKEIIEREGLHPEKLYHELIPLEKYEKTKRN